MSGWRRPEPEPTPRLRFGSHRPRYLAAIALLVAGGITLQFGSAYTLWFIIVGVLASAAGWIIVPASGGTRALVVVPAVLGVAAMLGGAQAAVLTALTLASWLFVRSRRARSYVVLALPVLAALTLGSLFPHYGWGTLVSAVMGVVLVASAWLAWRIDRTRSSRSARTRRPSSRNRANVP